MLSILAFFSGILMTNAAPVTIDQRNCVQYSGHVVAIEIQFPRPARLEMCYFWGEYGGMSTRALSSGRNNLYGGADANQAYRATRNQTIGACLRHSGQSILGRRQLNGNIATVRLCLFRDNSVMDEATLEAGVSSPWNRELNRALNIL